MQKLVNACLVAAAALAMGATGCTSPVPDVPTGETSQALSNKELYYEYYSDDSYTTQVGTYFSSCTGGAGLSGQRTPYIIGDQTKCRTGVTVECYRLVNSQFTCGSGIC